MKEKNIAVVLAAGTGKRMGTDIAKQYLLIGDKPVLAYSLQTFDECPFMDEIILVTSAEHIEYCRKEIVEKYGIRKVSHIIAGGAERYLSVYEGLKAIKDCDYVYIHDGARPFADEAILDRVHEEVKKSGACVAAVPAKDTVKISDEDGFADVTPERSRVWTVQTPQVFAYKTIKNAYTRLIEEKLSDTVTDDAMVLEVVNKSRVKLVMGSYENIKITTPEDLDIAEVFCQRR